MNKAVKSAEAAHGNTAILSPVTSTTAMGVVTVKANSTQPTAVKPLTPAETELLAKCEKIIRQGLAAFKEVYEALQEVRDQGLYRTKHATFEDYCRLEWGITARHANRFMLAGGVVENLKSDQLVSLKPVAIPENEAQARPLTGLTQSKQIEAARKVAQKPGKHTAKDFEDAAEEVSGDETKGVKSSNTMVEDNEEKPRVQCYDPREEDKGNGHIQPGKGTAKAKDNGDLEKLLELVDAAETQARKTSGCNDVVKTLNELGKVITRKMNGGAK